jgi:hypothetical protein
VGDSVGTGDCGDDRWGSAGESVDSVDGYGGVRRCASAGAVARVDDHGGEAGGAGAEFCAVGACLPAGGRCGRGCRASADRRAVSGNGAAAGGSARALGLYGARTRLKHVGWRTRRPRGRRCPVRRGGARTAAGAWRGRAGLLRPRVQLLRLEPARSRVDRTRGCFGARAGRRWEEGSKRAPGERSQVTGARDRSGWASGATAPGRSTSSSIGSHLRWVAHRCGLPISRCGLPTSGALISPDGTAASATAGAAVPGVRS